MLLQPDQRIKLDESSDTDFYNAPRFVTHVDDGFIAKLTDLYRDRLTPHSRIFDMMSSWVSHLPSDMEFAHVEGHGLNAEELAKNRRLDHYFVQKSCWGITERTTFDDSGFVLVPALSSHQVEVP